MSIVKSAFQKLIDNIIYDEILKLTALIQQGTFFLEAVKHWNMRKFLSCYYCAVWSAPINIEEHCSLKDSCWKCQEIMKKLKVCLVGVGYA